jgi:hypothetical protein
MGHPREAEVLEGRWGSVAAMALRALGAPVARETQVAAGP